MDKQNSVFDKKIPEKVESKICIALDKLEREGVLTKYIIQHLGEWGYIGMFYEDASPLEKTPEWSQKYEEKTAELANKTKTILLKALYQNEREHKILEESIKRLITMD